MEIIHIHRRKAFYKIFMSPKKYAKFIGVKFGENCFFATKNWSSEPYLIEVGNNVQITNGVSIHTHGGGHVARFLIPNFDTFGKVVIKDGAYVGAYSQIMPGVTIGEGAGQNWWCVAFPSLCFAATAEGFEEAASCGGFTDELIDTLEGKDGYEIRFFLMELLGRMENLLHRE